MSKLQVIPSVKGIEDKHVVEVLTALHDSGVNATKIIFDAGLYCFFIKDNLPNGQFGHWLKANAPQRMWRLDAKGNPKASSSLSWQMAFTQKMVESCKSTIEKVLSQIPNTWEFGNRGKFLVLSSGIPKPLLQLHDECADKVEGKTAYQLFLEFKQADDEGKPHVGRLPGSGGATKEQRAVAAQTEAQERITAMSLKAEEFADWIEEVFEDGKIDELFGSPELNRLDEQMGYARGYIKHNGGAK